MHDILWVLAAALLGGVVFACVGLIAGTSESATIAPATLLVVLLGFPPAACFAFCIAAIVSKHIVHAAPTALLGIPGDTMAVPMLEPCAVLRRLGVPHIALQKMISGGVIASVVSIPIAVAFASLLAPFGDIVKAWAGAIFTMVAIGIAYSSKGRWASLFMLIPFALIIQALDRAALASVGNRLAISFSLGIAIGPLFGDLLTALSPVSRGLLVRPRPSEVWLAPDVKSWSTFFPNPWKILTRRQRLYTLLASAVSAVTFTFSPIGMTIMIGELVQSRLKSLYERHTTAVAVMNATTESTYLAEVVIPLVAFGIPLSPIAMIVAFPLFNAPPVFTSEPVHNLHTMMSATEFLGYGVISVLIACVVSYPITMNYSHRAAAWTMKHVSQEAILTMFAGLIVVLSYYDGRWVGVAIAVTIGSIGGVLNKFFGVNVGVQFMTLYASTWIVQQLFHIR